MRQQGKCIGGVDRILRVSVPAIVLALAVACSSGGARPTGGEPGAAGGAVLLDRERALMGTFFRIQVMSHDAAERARVEAAIDAALSEVARVEALLSEWRDTSELSAVNLEAGGRAVAVGPELFEVVMRSLEMRELTGNAFDITFAGCGRLWSFRPPRIPKATEIEACLPRVGKEILLDAAQSTIYLPEPNMRIGLGGIGKGYGVDRAVEVLESRGIVDYIVNGGGDIRLAGRKGDRHWSVGIAHPRQLGRLYAALEMDRGAVVTSGDYQKFFEQDGVRYHHILDPRTGRPARRSAAVTVLAPDATRADALATGLFVMGPEEGLALVEQLPGVEALFFAPDLTIHRSSGFPEMS